MAHILVSENIFDMTLPLNFIVPKTGSQKHIFIPFSCFRCGMWPWNHVYLYEEWVVVVCHCCGGHQTAASFWLGAPHQCSECGNVSPGLVRSGPSSIVDAQYVLTGVTCYKTTKYLFLWRITYHMIVINAK